VTIAANAGVSGSSGTIYVPSENGTFLTTATSYAGAINIATSNSNNNIALKPHGTGFVQVGNGGATGKVTSNGAYDLIMSTNSGTNSGTITITDAANGNIDITPNGTGEVNISKVDIDGGTVDGATIGASSHTTGKFTTCDATTDFTIGGLVLTDGNIADTGTLALVPVDGCTIALGSDAGDDFNVDSGKLVVEGDTGRVGIGTASPTQMVDLQASAPILRIGSYSTTNATNGSLDFFKSDNGSLGTQTQTDDGDRLGTINFLGTDTTGSAESGSMITCYQTGTAGSAGIPTDLRFYTSTVSTPRIERLQIDSEGIVSIAAGGDLETSTTGKIKQKGSAFQSHITASLALGY